MPKPTTRRGFMSQSSRLATAGAVTSVIAGVHGYAQEKDDRINLGIIGCGGIMRHHIRGLISRKENVSFAWLCDVDPAHIDNALKLVSGFQSSAPKHSTRYEDVLGDEQVDAVIIATPHHWHAPMAIDALAAGKDVYLEKPISHVYNEGPLVVQAAKKHGRIVQQGSQMRSSPVTLKAGKLLAEGIIGDIKVARAWTAESRRTIRPVPDGAPPENVDYDRWLGPAPRRAFNLHRFHRTWRLFHDYGNGEIGDDGIHDLDMACWGLGIDTLPSQITARGSRMMLHGHVGDYPDNMHVTYEFADGKLLVYENYPFTSYGMHGFDNGNVFYGTEGYMVFSRRGAFSVFLGPKEKPGPTEGREIRGNRGYAEHMADFFAAVRSRGAVRASADVAHRSCALVHLGEIAMRTRGRLEFDPQRESFINAEEANAMLKKEYREPYGIS